MSTPAPVRKGLRMQQDANITLLDLFVPGVPVSGQGQHTVVNRHTGGVFTAKSERAKAWQSYLRMMIANAYNGPLHDDAVRLYVLAVFPRPKGVSRNKHYKTTRPDSDNITKPLKDALEGIVITNDARIASESIERVYVTKDAQPGVYIRLERLLEPNVRRS